MNGSDKEEIPPSCMKHEPLLAARLRGTTGEVRHASGDWAEQALQAATGTQLGFNVSDRGNHEKKGRRLTWDAGAAFDSSGR